MDKKNNKRTIKIVLVCFLMAIISLFTAYRYTEYVKALRIEEIKDYLLVEFTDEIQFVEYGTDFNEKQFVQKYTGELVYHDELDTNRVGMQQLRYIVSYVDEKYGEITKDFFYTATTKDTCPPEIILDKEKITLSYGASFDIKSNIKSVTDPVEGNLEYKIEGSVNNKKAGTYTITVSAVDINGLETNKTFTVKVNEQYSEVSNGGGVKIASTAYAIPKSIAQGSLNDNEYQVLKEILNALNTSDSNKVEIPTLLDGTINDAKNILNIISKKMGVTLAFDSLVRVNENRVCMGDGGNKYTKIVIDVKTTKKRINSANEYDNLVRNALKSAGVTNGMSHKTAVIKINNWICKKMTYVINNGDGIVGFQTGKGQCHTYAEMFRDMCNMAGISCQYVSGNAYSGGKWIGHAWNKVKLGGTWYYVDSTWNDTTGTSKYLLSKTLWSSHKLK